MKTKTPATFNDFVGKPIKVGDVIAYGKSFGRCAGLNVGVVLESYKIEYDCYGRPQLRITILCNQDTWKDFSKLDPAAVNYRGKSEIKKTTLQFSNRMIVISNVDDLGNSPMAQYFKDFIKTI
jgi:hypothetical protein